MLNSKVKVSNAQSITILSLTILLLCNFVFVMHLGRPSADFANSTLSNYLIIYLVKIIFQILLVIFCGWFLYIFFINSRSKFVNVKWYLKLGIALILIFFNMPSVYSISLIPQYVHGIKVTDLSEFSLYTKRFDHGRRSISYSYRNFIKIDNHEYEISDAIFNKLDCAKGEKNTLWIKTCYQRYEFYYLEFEEGLLDIKEK